VVRHTKGEAKMPTRRLPPQLIHQIHNQIHRLVHSNIQLAAQTQPIVTSSIPLIAPGLAATAVFIMIYTWSDYIFVLFLTARNVSNIQLAVARFNAEYYVEWGPLLASSIISILPVILLVALVQKSMIKGLTLGALKG
jgi:multiple sugar transport system permease protein